MSVVVLFAACGGSDSTSPGSSAAASVTIQWNGVPLQQDSTAQLQAIVKDASGRVLAGKTVAWSTSDPTLATVSPTGLVKAVGRTGTARITATVDATTGSADVPVWWMYPVGTYAVSVVSSITVHDSAFARDIPVLVRLPKGAPTPLPVVFDVYPTQGCQTCDTAWGGRMAAAGFAVIHVGTAPYHADQLCVAYQVPDCGSIILPDRIEAARDVKLLLSNLSTIATGASTTFDSTRVGVEGVSAGAAVVMYLAGAKVNLSPSVQGVTVLADPRFAAFLADSPPDTTTAAGAPSGFTSSSWATITRPAMVQTSSGDADAFRRMAYDDMPAGNKYLAYYSTSSVTHEDLGFLDGPFANFITADGVAFFDAILRGKADATSWLTTNQLASGTNGTGAISFK